MLKMICFDMDGTVADLYGVENWLEKLRAYDASPYLVATPMCDMEELADLLEVMSAVAVARGSSMKEVEKIRVGKKEKRGGFEKRILLESVTEQGD